MLEHVKLQLMYSGNKWACRNPHQMSMLEFCFWDFMTKHYSIICHTNFRQRSFLCKLFCQVPILQQQLWRTYNLPSKTDQHCCLLKCTLHCRTQGLSTLKWSSWSLLLNEYSNLRELLKTHFLFASGNSERKKNNKNNGLWNTPPIKLAWSLNLVFPWFHSCVPYHSVHVVKIYL